jgi:hypothetical protein
MWLLNPWLQPARKVLGSTAANEALEHGRALRLETAIALALESDWGAVLGSPEGHPAL